MANALDIADEEMDDSSTFVFEGKEEDIDDDDEEDAKILDMTLIKSILGNSNQANIQDCDGPNKVQETKKVSFRDVGSVASSHEDDDKTHDELVNKIGSLQAKLTQLSIDMSAEKAMRRKKDKSLVKLAKELNKRAADQTAKEKQINLLKGSIADLEAKLGATRSEMDERIATNEKKTKEYNSQLDESHQKYRNFVAEHDSIVADLTKTHNAETEGLRRKIKDGEMEMERLRAHIGTVRTQAEAKIADAEKGVESQKTLSTEAQQKVKDTILEFEQKISEINKKHESQVDDLRHQLLAAKLECDMIRTELASLQMQASPGDAANIVDRTMKSASLRRSSAPPKASIFGIISQFVRNIIAMIVVLLAVAYPLGLLSMDAICAPVPPGTSLGGDNAAFYAPWWANDSLKADAFAICGERPRTSLKWNGGRLVVTDLETSKVLLDKRSTTASVHGSVVNLYAKNSKIETLRSPWSK